MRLIHHLAGNAAGEIIVALQARIGDVGFPRTDGQEPSFLVSGSNLPVIVMELPKMSKIDWRY